MKREPPFFSPPWSKSNKRLVTTFLIVLTLLLVYWMRGLLIYILAAVIIAYLIHPLVAALHSQTGLPRLAAIALVYILIVAGLASIPITTIPQIINQFNALVANTPRYVVQFNEVLSDPINIGDYSFAIGELPQVEQALATVNENLVDIAQTIGSRSFSIFGSVATATLSTVGWLLVVLFLSFYMVKDHQLLFDAVLRAVPPAYEDDIYRLASEISATWNAFLRGQLILFTIMGATVFTLATIAGLPNALLLGLVSGLAEFLPQIGATLAMIPAVLVAFFQNEASWLGRQMSPFWFTMLIMATYILLQQIENYWLVPRVIGRQLNLHPLLVFVAALVGARSAGILGILVAAPLLATARLVMRYLYAKLRDLPPFPEATAVPAQPEEGAMPELVFRPATMADETAVSQLASHIWDGDDYVPDAFADWVNDRHGQFTVVYQGDELVAFGKLTRLMDGEWWLEGLRVAPQHRHRGLARRLHYHAVELAEQVGSGMLRFATADSNTAVHKIAAETGFREVSRHLLARAAVRPGDGADCLVAVAPDELDAVQRWLDASSTLTAAGGLVEDDWVWVELCSRLEAWLSDGRLYWWLGEGERRGLVCLRPDEETLRLNYLDAPERELGELARALPTLTARLGFEQLKGKPLASPALRDALAAAGWEVDDLQMCVYERPI